MLARRGRVRMPPDGPERRIPYLVKFDPPNRRLICVPRDDSDVVRAEACFECTVEALP